MIGITRRAPFSELAVFIAIIITLLPLGWMVLNSFQYVRDIIQPGISTELTPYNYEQIFSPGSTFLKQFGNSLIIVSASTLLCVVVGALAAYSLSKLRWPNAVTALLLATALFIQLVPPMTLVPALFVTLVQFGLIDTLAGLIVMHTVFHLPFAVLLLKVYFDSVPDQLREAALVDGASEFKAFRRIMLPVITPGIAAVTILTAILSWNEFLLGLTLTRGPDAAPLTVAIATFIQAYNIRFGDMTAAGTVAAVPIIVLSIVAYRYIVTGLTSGSVKG